MENHKPDDTIKENLIFHIITRKINQLPEAERNLLEYGSTYVGLNAAFCGLIANSLFHRVLHVTKARIASGLPMAVIPYLTVNVLRVFIAKVCPISHHSCFHLRRLCYSNWMSADQKVTWPYKYQTYEQGA
uniref:Transmembrane protein 126A n=1 Tax=Castor canadensis TaxID=51338 RepID=A0A8C0ZRM3_CASCN